MTNHNDEYERDNPYAYEWTLAAFEAIKNGTLTREIVRKEERIIARVHGACPRCHRDIHAQMDLTQIEGIGVLGVERVDDTGDTIQFDVRCNCKLPHRHAPRGSEGCGIGFRVELREGRDG
jgi:hypothetical protein